MLKDQPFILTDYPSPLRGSLADASKAEAGKAIIRWLGRHGNQDRHRLYVGPTGARRDLNLQQIAAKWLADRTRFGVTDLHIRHSNTEKIIDPDTLSAFNLLNISGAMASEQEMYSFVISSRGQVTDSHSDAPDSSNFCFTGQKLWLAWDTYEGMKQGLQDVDRMPLAGKARFDMETWLSLKSARWFLVNEGETSFLPAHLTHKVITLQRYVGVGGFFIALPNCLRVMSHWVSRIPLWSKKDVHGERDALLDDIAQAVRGQITTLGRGSRREQARWGYDYLSRSAEHFIGTRSSTQLKTLRSDPRFASIVDAIDADWPKSRRRNTDLGVVSKPTELAI